MIEINNYLQPTILACCLVLGVILKQAANASGNNTIKDWIPVILTLVGAALAIVTDIDAISLEVITAGAMTGLASTGLHQAFTRSLASLGGSGEENDGSN